METSGEARPTSDDPSPGDSPAPSDAFAKACARWPGVHVGPAVFARELAARVSADAPLDGLHSDDLYLAIACSLGDESAIAAAEAHCFPVVDAGLRALRASPELAEETKQGLREWLFVTSADGRPGIVRYSGRGKLSGWMRITALRRALRILRDTKKDVRSDDDMIDALEAPGNDPEVAHLKRLYRSSYKAAFETALASLAPRDRNLLRYEIVAGLSQDRIAALYDTHRATVSRWLTAARKTLVLRTRVAFVEHTRLPRDDLTSVMQLIRSQLDLSLQRVLGATELETDSDPESP